jgi:hypothetical protein
MLFHLEMLLDTKVVAALFWAVLANLVIGTVWYNPRVFGSTWQKLSGLKWDSSEMAKAVSGNALSALLMAAVMICFAMRLGLHDIRQGVELGFMLWLGFMMPGALDGVLFAKKPVKLFLLNTGCDLIKLVTMSFFIVTNLSK